MCSREGSLLFACLLGMHNREESPEVLKLLWESLSMFPPNVIRDVARQGV